MTSSIIGLETDFCYGKVFSVYSGPKADICIKADSVIGPIYWGFSTGVSASKPEATCMSFGNPRFLRVSPSLWINSVRLNGF